MVRIPLAPPFSLLRSPYAQRRALLDGLGLAEGHLSVPPAFPGQAQALTDASRDLGLEGEIRKRLTSRYQPGQRTCDWPKIRHLTAADVLIGGWLPRAGTRTAVAGSVLAGAPGPAGLDYLGSVGSGLAEAEAPTSPPDCWASSSRTRHSPPPCRPTSPAGPAGPAPCSPPRSSTPGSPRPGGCATRSGAACARRERSRVCETLHVSWRPFTELGGRLESGGEALTLAAVALCLRNVEDRS